MPILGILFFYKFEKIKDMAVDSILTKECIKHVLGFREHHNNDVDNLDPDLLITESGEYFQDFHPAMDLGIIKQSLERNRDLNQYLLDKRDAAITQLLNDVQELRITKGEKDLLFSDAILKKIGFSGDKIIAEGRFVGFLFVPLNENGLKISLHDIGLQLNGAQPSLNLYVYHSSQAEPVKIIELSVANANGWNWQNKKIELPTDSGEGVYYIGYYQDDLVANAINYTDFDWSIGHCSTCDGGVMRKVWNNARKYLYWMPFYVPAPNLNDDRTMFETEAVMVEKTKSWGINFKAQASCDYTDVYCSNRKFLKTALGLKMALLVLHDIKFSQQINHINDDLKILIRTDLDGDKETTALNLAQRYLIAKKNVYIDTGGLSPKCLPCTDKSGVSYEQA